jgi:hypothetical protein
MRFAVLGPEHVVACPELPYPDPFSPALPKTHPLANTLNPEDIGRPAIGVKLSFATRPSILAGESSVVSSIAEI